MHLTLALLKPRNIIPGNRWLGKHKMPICVYPWNIEAFTKRLQVEEKNMFYLRHPYITFEQEQGHAVALKKHESWMNEKKLQKAARKVQPSIRMEKYLGHLNVANNWEI